jgi:hypothetical protein
MKVVRNSRRASLAIGIGALFAGSLVATLSACGGGNSAPAAVGAPGQVPLSAWPQDDRSMCNWRGKPDLEVSEIAGAGSLKPNVRRVFRTVGDREHQHRVIACREVDTNLDGIKDVVRLFDEKGEPSREEADRDFDGKIDGWTLFAEGRMAEFQEDTNRDGRPDVWKSYNEGRLTRVKRDRNFDGKPDQWEMYVRGKLERVGVDDSYDGHVDRWDRDEQLRMEQENAERTARETMAAAQNAAAQAAGGAGSSDAGSGDASAPDGAAPGSGK